MNVVPDIMLFMRRVGPHHAEQMASIAKHTQQDFNLIYVYQDGTTASQALNLAIKRSTSRFMVIMDDDVVILQEGWLRKLLAPMEQLDSLAEVTPLELKTPEQRDGWPGNRNVNDNSLWSVSWNSGFVFAVDRDKVPDLLADEDIPGKVQMTDVDLSLQIRSVGYQIGQLATVTVYHPQKVFVFTPEQMQQYGLYTDDEIHSWYPEQVAYMQKKWGAFFQSSMYHRILGQLPYKETTGV